MKKIGVLLLALAMSIALVGCSGGDNESKEESTSKDVSVEQSVEPTEESQDTAADSGDLGDYHVAILDHTITTDYEGNPAIVVNFEFTNNSDANVMFSVATSAQAFQDGVQLSAAVISDANVYDSLLSLKEVQPGGTLTVQMAYVLTSETSQVQVDVSELISLDNTTLTKTFDLQ